MYNNSIGTVSKLVPCFADEKSICFIIENLKLYEGKGET